MRLLRTLVLLSMLCALVLVPGAAPRVPAAHLWTPITVERLNHGRFAEFPVFVPHGTPQGVVLLLSGNDGWDLGMNAIAEKIAVQGALVAGLDVVKFNAALEADGGQCVFPDGDLENLSHFIQAYYRLQTYFAPILAGYSTGGTLAYATLIQAPKGTFSGAISLNFCPAYALHKPLCSGSGIEFKPLDGGVSFKPSNLTGNSWTVLQSRDFNGCQPQSVRTFTSQVPGASFVATTGTDAWSQFYAAPFNALLALQHDIAGTAVPSVLSDLPIITVPAVGVTDTFAILLSGDGGWAGLDKEVAGALAATGIPVIGLDSLRYFWSARTPAGLAADIDRMTAYYVSQYHAAHVMLVGYSQGADVLPFAVNKLSPATRSHVSLATVIGMSEHALFEFHMTSWVSDDNSGPPTMPEVERITGIPMLCIYGQDETDTLCPKLDPHKVMIVKLKGGHHFDGDYAALARTILNAARHESPGAP